MKRNNFLKCHRNAVHICTLVVVIGTTSNAFAQAMQTTPKSLSTVAQSPKTVTTAGASSGNASNANNEPASATNPTGVVGPTSTATTDSTGVPTTPSPDPKAPVVPQGITGGAVPAAAVAVPTAAPTNAIPQDAQISAFTGRAPVNTSNRSNALSQPTLGTAPRMGDESSLEVRKTRFPFALFLDVSPLSQKSRGYDLFSKQDASVRTGLTLEADIAEISDQMYVSVDLGGSVESASDTVLGNFTTDLNVANVGGGLRLRKEFLSILATHVSVLGGASRIATNFNEGRESTDWVPTAQVGGGISASIPNVRTVKPGLLVEGGYFLSGNTELVMKEPVIEGAISRQSANLGTLERSGAYLRIAAFLRY